MPGRMRPPLRLLAVALAVALAALGCSSGDDDGDAASRTTAAPPETTASSTTAAPTTGSTAPPPTAPSQPTASTDTARDAINELKAAWEAGDRARALAIAPSDVVDALFLVPPDGYTVQGCDTGEFETSYCNYRNRATGGFINVAAQRTPDGRWQVATIDVTQD